MALNILSRSSNSPISTGKRSIAIAEIVIYSIIHIAQFSTRFMQERRYWHHNKNKSIGRCVLYSWWSMVGLLSQVRIAGSSLVLSTSRPDKPMLVAESVLQSVGLSPLLFEVSLIMLRCGQSGESGPGNSKWSKWTRFALHFFRFPIFIAIVLAVVGACINMHALGEAGSVVLVVTFAYVCCLVAWLAFKSRTILPESGHRAALVTVFTLPFLLVRIVYFLLLEYGPPRFNPATGDIGILVGMGLLMEIIVVILLLAARGVVEPVMPAFIAKHIVYDDLESPSN
ncbi:hypothetical protein PENANT_c006G08081 [Penicillium antarcticum]|uniref:DUF7702 domain-containing protein n=1 Tax=Penicillium antarcticum TaxID=416450 RepID=A0A1V6QCX6_9EURO|nr:uncharacterized protein N7508_009168 [Penicillium antarcticum]KAJ5294347.1 hypothetical protein N7508_009168 [Penicillium antarcticum]OQD87061.1 hypothetical protein PENANT_c006G08081 [Penicillium antarcticum]